MDYLICRIVVITAISNFLFNQSIIIIVSGVPSLRLVLWHPCWFAPGQPWNRTITYVNLFLAGLFDFQGSIWQGWITWILVLTTTTAKKKQQQQINNNCNRTTTTITTATTGQQQQQQQQQQKQDNNNNNNSNSKNVKVQITSILVWASRMFSLSAWWPGVTLWGAAISKTTKDGGGV